jgi:hypothetical protein
MMTNRPVEEQLIHSYAAEKINVKSAISANLLIMLTIHHYPKFFFPLRIILFHILSKLTNSCVNKLIHIFVHIFIHSS